MYAKDVEVIRSAIFREQLPRWSSATKKLLLADAGLFVLGSIGHLLSIRFSESLIAFSLIIVVATLASTAKPIGTGQKFSATPITPDTITVLRAQLSKRTLERLIFARDQDEQRLLRVAHLQALAAPCEADQTSAFGQAE